MWNMRREAKDINCSPHLDGSMAASSTSPLILLGFFNLRTSQNCDFVVIQTDLNDGQNPSCASTQHSRCMCEAEASRLLLPGCHPEADARPTEHEFCRIGSPNAGPEFLQASVDLKRLPSQSLKYAEVSLVSDSLVPLKVDTKS